MSEGSAERVGDERIWFRRPDGDAMRDVPAPWRPGDPPANDEPAYRPRRGTHATLPRVASAAGRAWRAIPAALQLESERGTAFLFIPVLMAAGALGYFALPFEPDFRVVLAVTAACVVAARWWRYRPVLHRLAIVLLVVCVGAGSAKFEAWRADTKMLGGEISTRLTGRVVAIEDMSGGRARITLDLLSTQRPTLRYAPERIRATARKLPPGVRAGDILAGVARLAPPPGPTRPGGYDFAFASYFQGIGATGFFLTDPQLVTAGGDVGTWQALSDQVQNLRAAIADHIRARIGGAAGEIAAALAVGVTAGIPNDVSEALRRSGLYHIISISGLHMALVAGMVLATLRFACALFPGFASRHPVRKVAAALALIAISGYLVISGAQVAAQRSYLMLAVMLAAVLFDRAALTMRNLAISAILVIAWSPHEVVGPSFQMSFAATAALVGAYALWNDFRSRRPASRPTGSLATRSRLRGLLGKGWRMVWGLALTSLVAGVATAIFGAYHFQRVSPLSLFANLATAPVVSGIVVPAGLVAALAAPFGLDGPFLDLMGWGLNAMIAVCRWFSDRSPLDSVGLVPGIAVVFATLALVIATAATTWLRALAIPLALAAMATMGTASTPDVLIAEDGRTVGVPAASGAIALNRPHGGGFTVNDWMRATRADRITRPRLAESGAKLPWADMANFADESFACDATGCAVRSRDGALIVRLDDAEEVLRACDYADVIVVGDPLGPERCADARVAVIPARRLALNGSATIHLPKLSPDDPAVVDYAIPDTARPWQDHRRFSRIARGIPERERPKGKAGEPAPDETPLPPDERE